MSERDRGRERMKFRERDWVIDREREIESE